MKKRSFAGFFLAAVFLLPAPARAANEWFRLGLDGKGVGTVVLDPSDGRRIYAAGGYDGDLRGIWKSSDRGRTWADSSSSLPQPIVLSLAVDRKSPGTLYAINGWTPLSFFYQSDLPGIYKSEDAATTWAPLGEKGISVVAPRGSSGRIYMGGLFEVLSSDNGGQTWRRGGVPIVGPGIGDVLQVIALALAESDPSRVYAGVDMDYPYTPPVYRSDDAGGSWKSGNNTGLSYASTRSIVVDPLDHDRVLAATSRGIYSSLDGAQSWTQTLSDPATALVADPADPAVFYAGTSRGVYRSADRGLTWTPLNSGLSDTRVLALAVDDTGRRLYAGTRSGLFGFDVALGFIDVAAGPGSGTDYLAATSITNRIVLGTVDAAGERSERGYGPYEGWTPAALANGRDGLARVLWRNTDGRSAVWLAAPGGVLGSFVLAAENGRTTVDVACGPDGQSHVLSTGPSGASLRTIDGFGNSVGSVDLGSYPGWTASAISEGADGLTLLLWTNDDGRTGISRVSPAGIVSTDRYAAVSGWTSADAAAGGDGRTRILRTDGNGRLRLWITDASGALSVEGPVYDAPREQTPRRLSTGADGTSRVLLTGSGSAGIVWVLSPEGVLEASIDLD